MRLCPRSLALASSIPVLGLERFCPRKGCPWPWPRIFFVFLALASSLVSSTPPMVCDFNCHLTLSNQNQIFLHTRITLKDVMRLRGPSPRHCAQATLLLSKKCRSSGEPLATLSNLTGPRFYLPL